MVDVVIWIFIGLHVFLHLSGVEMCFVHGKSVNMEQCLRCCPKSAVCD